MPPTKEVAQLEALRELKASSQRVGIRYAAETGAPLKDAEGNTLISPLLLYVQGNVLARPAALTEQATLDELQKPYVQIARSANPQLSDKAMLLRHSQAVVQAVKVFRPLMMTQHQSVQHVGKPTEIKEENTPGQPTPQQEAPAPKRKGPKL